MEERAIDNVRLLLNEITKFIANNFIMFVFITLAVVVILLFITRFVFKNTKYGIFVKQKIIDNPLLALLAIMLIIGLGTIEIWREFEDEVSLTAWSVIMSSAVVILTIMYSVIQSKITFRQQAALAELGFMPCLYLSNSQDKSKIILTGLSEANKTRNQTFDFECVSEYPAFNITWFVWINAVKPYKGKEYEKNRTQVTTATYTAVKGKTYAINLTLDNGIEEQVLVAEYKDKCKNLYCQTFALRLNKHLNIFEVCEIDSPTPIPPTARKKTKKQQ